MISRDSHMSRSAGPASPPALRLTCTPAPACMHRVCTVALRPQASAMSWQRTWSPWRGGSMRRSGGPGARGPAPSQLLRHRKLPQMDPRTGACPRPPLATPLWSPSGWGALAGTVWQCVRAACVAPGLCIMRAVCLCAALGLWIGGLVRWGSCCTAAEFWPERSVLQQPAANCSCQAHPVHGCWRGAGPPRVLRRCGTRTTRQAAGAWAPPSWRPPCCWPALTWLSSKTMSGWAAAAPAAACISALPRTHMCTPPGPQLLLRPRPGRTQALGERAGGCADSAAPAERAAERGLWPRHRAVYGLPVQPARGGPWASTLGWVRGAALQPVG